MPPTDPAELRQAGGFRATSISPVTVVWEDAFVNTTCNETDSGRRLDASGDASETADTADAAEPAATVLPQPAAGAMPTASTLQHEHAQQLAFSSSGEQLSQQPAADTSMPAGCLPPGTLGSGSSLSVEQQLLAMMRCLVVQNQAAAQPPAAAAQPLVAAAQPPAAPAQPPAADDAVSALPGTSRRLTVSGSGSSTPTPCTQKIDSTKDARIARARGAALLRNLTVVNTTASDLFAATSAHMLVASALLGLRPARCSALFAAPAASKPLPCPTPVLCTSCLCYSRTRCACLPSQSPI
jgi:hypothetical protein